MTLENYFMINFHESFVAGAQMPNHSLLGALTVAKTQSFSPAKSEYLPNAYHLLVFFCPASFIDCFVESCQCHFPVDLL